jgi:hypothetical protein
MQIRQLFSLINSHEYVYYILYIYNLYNLYSIFGARNDGSFDISLNVPVLGVNRPIRSNETNPLSELHARLSPHLFQRTQRSVPGWLHQWFCGYPASRSALRRPSKASPAASGGTKCLGNFCGMTQWNELESPKHQKWQVLWLKPPVIAMEPPPGLDFSSKAEGNTWMSKSICTRGY